MEQLVFLAALVHKNMRGTDCPWLGWVLSWFLIRETCFDPICCTAVLAASVFSSFVGRGWMKQKLIRNGETGVRDWWSISPVLYVSLGCDKWRAAVPWSICFGLILDVFPALDSRSFQNASVLAYKYTHTCIQNLVLFLCKLFLRWQVICDHHVWLGL